jgi:hypothetical protein
MPIKFFTKILSNPMVGAAVRMAFPAATPWLKALTFFQKIKEATGADTFQGAALQFFTNPKFKEWADDYEKNFKTSKDNFINAARFLDQQKGFAGTLGQLLKDTLNLPKVTN